MIQPPDDEGEDSGEDDCFGLDPEVMKRAFESLNRSPEVQAKEAALLAQIQQNVPEMYREIQALMKREGIDFDEATKRVSAERRRLREETDALLRDIDEETR
jgi:hypothetical protein